MATSKPEEATASPIVGTVAGGQAQQPQPKFVQTAEPIVESYSDGVIGISLRHGVATIETYRVIGMDEQTKGEIRRVSNRIMMPLAGLDEFTGLLRRMSQAINQQAAQAKDGTTKV